MEIQNYQLDEPKKSIQKENIIVTDELINQILQDSDEFIDILNRPGNFKKAMNHFKASQLYKSSYFDNKQNIQFCDDCLNPIPDENDNKKPEKYPICTSMKSVAELGIGVYLYFYFIKFIFFICCLIFGVVAIVEIYLSKSYNSQLQGYCLSKNMTEKSNIGLEVCSNFLKRDYNSTFYIMNIENIREYKKIVNDKYEYLVNDTMVNLNLIHLVCMCIMFVLNNIYLILFSNLDKEIDIEIITPKDFTLMISDIPKDQSESFELLKEKYLNVDDICPYEINPTYKIGFFQELKKKYGLLKKNLRYIHHYKLNEYKSGLISSISKDELVKEIVILDNRLDEFIDKLNSINTNKYLFNGVVFATFNSIQDLETYLQKFPQTYIGKAMRFLNYTFLNCLYKHKTLTYMKQSLEISVTNAPEPNDVIWENLEVSNSERRIRILEMIFILLLILGMSFGVLLGISYGQSKIKISNWTVKNIVSVVFAIVTSLFNFIITKVMIKLTEYEKNVSRTNYLLSLSIKLLVFTFLNSSVLVVIVGYLANNNNVENLVNNVFYIFIINSLSSPLIYLTNPFNIIRYFKRKAITEKILENSSEYIDLTQGELNEIFEFTDIELAFKYSYIGKTIALVVFYIPILPLGAPISFLGFILLYLIEKINVLYFYRRPEKINGSLTLTYMNFFKFIIFIYSISVYVFIGDIYTLNEKYHLIAIILFGVLNIIPFDSFFKRLSFLKITDLNKSKYSDIYFELGMTYDMSNPMTKSKGFEKYIDKLKEKNIINEDEYRELLVKVSTDPSDIIEMYYKKKYHKISSKWTKKEMGYLNNKFKSVKTFGFKKDKSRKNINQNENNNKIDIIENKNDDLKEFNKSSIDEEGFKYIPDINEYILNADEKKIPNFYEVNDNQNNQKNENFHQNDKPYYD